MSHVWIAEARHWYGKEWSPCLGFAGHIPEEHIRGVHLVRSAAREAAKKMQKKNTYNHLTKGHTSVYYRAAKYVRED